MDVLVIPVVAIISTFTMIVLVVWFAARAKQRQARYRAEVQTKLIEKFNSAPELAEFLTSQAGKDFVGAMREPVRVSAHERILSGVKWSLILTFIGIALIVARYSGEDSDLIIPGGILIALGVGWAIATVVSYRLSRSWGLIDQPTETPNLPTANGLR